MTCPFFSPEAKIGRARFDGQGAKRLGMPSDYNPFPPGQMRDAWAEGWDSIPRWRRTDFREGRAGMGRSPAPRACPDPNPRRTPYE